MSHNEHPYPIRERQNGWEVVVIHDEQVLKYILCDSKEEAESAADARGLSYISVTGGQCERDRIQRCIAALKNHGMDARVLLVRRLMSLEGRS